MKRLPAEEEFELLLRRAVFFSKVFKKQQFFLLSYCIIECRENQKHIQEEI